MAKNVLKCVTWNVNAVVDVDVHQARIAQVIESLTVADTDHVVISLQEVTTPWSSNEDDMKKQLIKWNLLLQKLIPKHEIQEAHSDTGVAMFVLTPKMNENGVICRTIVTHAAGFALFGYKFHTKATVTCYIRTANNSSVVAIVNSHLPSYHYDFGLFKDRGNMVDADSERSNAIREAEDDTHGSRILKLCKHVIWMGDFNFRTHTSAQPDRNYARQDNHPVSPEDTEPFTSSRDGLRQCMLHPIDNACVFIDYQEDKITFLPTYKIPLGRIKKKAGKEWTDRIIYKGMESIPNTYKSIPTKETVENFSDHTPVYMFFNLDVRTCPTCKKNTVS
jgi:endonuclease/exonuclease/phosphatase family metal-dependent hydrolase